MADEHEHGHGAGAAGESHRSAAEVVSIIVASVLSGVGTFMMINWVITLDASWFWFLGVVPLILGALLFFHPITGPEGAGPRSQPA